MLVWTHSAIQSRSHRQAIMPNSTIHQNQSRHAKANGYSIASVSTNLNRTSFTRRNAISASWMQTQTQPHEDTRILVICWTPLQKRTSMVSRLMLALKGHFYTSIRKANSIPRLCTCAKSMCKKRCCRFLLMYYRVRKYSSDFRCMIGTPTANARRRTYWSA